jgi:hypothetical protein
MIFRHLVEAEGELLGAALANGAPASADCRHPGDISE